MEAMNIPNVTGAELDWPSLGWALLMACITAACLWVKSAYPRIAESGAVARVVAHVVIGYFGLGMLAFGLASALQSRLPVPGGIAWEGPVAVIGGLAAAVIGGTTLVEHGMQVLADRRVGRLVAAQAHAGQDAGRASG